RRFDGRYRWFLFCAAPFQAASGDLAGWCGTHVDIEDRKHAEDLRRSSERQLNQILDNIPALVAIHNASGTLELYNRASREFHGPGVSGPQQWRLGRAGHP